MDYSKYEVEDFMLDESFQRYAVEKNTKDSAYWEEVMKRYPDKRAKIEKAQQILGYLTFQGQPIPEGVFEEDFSRIKTFITARSRHQFFLKKYWLGLAAGISIFILSGMGAYYYFSHVPEAGQAATEGIQYIEKVVGKGQKLIVFLEDGSKVKINAESKLRIPQHFAAGKRNVYLEGEAFFEVAKDTTRPFIIHTRHYQTTVLGTSFNIKAYPGEEAIKVAVATGKVMVEDSLTADSVELAPNQMAICRQRQIEKTSYKAGEELAWKDDILVFKNADIRALARELERWYGVKIELRNTENIEKQFTGRFQDESLETILKGTGFALNFEYEIKGKNIIIKGKKHKKYEQSHR